MGMGRIPAWKLDQPRKSPYTARLRLPGVRWQSGDAEDCKSSNAGSIPARTSNAAAPGAAKGYFGRHTSVDETA